MNDHVILQYIEAGGRAAFYNLVDERTGVEFLLEIEEAARLLVGLGFFVKLDPELAEAVSVAAREAGMEATFGYVTAHVEAEARR